MERIPVSGPWITQREIQILTDAVTNGRSPVKSPGMYVNSLRK